MTPALPFMAGVALPAPDPASMADLLEDAARRTAGRALALHAAGHRAAATIAAREAEQLIAIAAHAQPRRPS